MKNWCILFFFFSVQLTAQTVDELTKSLTNDVANDSLKVVRIYDWVTKNIAYDNHFLRNRVEGDTALLQEPYNVVVRKKAICIGYAKLIKTMCRQAGIEAVIVYGFTKTKNDEIDREEHAWNAVKINARWQLLDATWDVGVSVGLRKYCMPYPSVFSENHYPHDPIWQLMDYPKSYNCFKWEKFCSTSPKAYFNYRDTLAVWEKKDTLARLMDAGQRTLRYFPADVDAIRNMANAQNHYAVDAYYTYSKVREDVVARRNVLLSKAEALKLLDKVEFHLEEARQYYEKLTTFARIGTFTDAHINRDMMMENIMKLDKERKFVEKYIK